MSLPNNITKDNLLKAVEKIDNEGMPSNSDSRYYDVIYNNKKYPPKLIISYANLFANGYILDRNTFEGGLDTECFNLLEQNGFTIEEKPDISKTILKFLNQAHEKPVNLKTKDYNKTFNGLKIRVSFGQGNAAVIPWIALLNDSQEVSKGIYPVYLYFKEQKVLVLAYGISETERPDVNWSVQAQTVDNLLRNEFSHNADRYGNSLVYKYYRINIEDQNFGLDLKELNKDAIDITNFYNQLFLNAKSTISQPRSFTIHLDDNYRFTYKQFITDLKEANLNFKTSFIVRFISSLLTKPFVILTGLSGSGKTKLAHAFAKWVCEDENQICIVPVGADWTNREPLLGYLNALNNEDYVLPENGALSLIIEANKDENKSKPFFLILDEMNLSHVERYFADFLSVMESDNTISLHTKASSTEENMVPAKLKLPKNLFIVGTVNVDETTYMFSPKVLDRANVIEFRVSETDMQAYLENAGNTKMDALNRKGTFMAESFVQIAKDIELKFSETKELNTALITFFRELQKVGAEFGYRAAAEITRFAAVANKIEPELQVNDIIDAAIMQKLLPKVHGSRRKLEPVLKKLGELCISSTEDINNLLTNETIIDFADRDKFKYPISLEKIKRMFQNLLVNSFTSYAEA